MNYNVSKTTSKILKTKEMVVYR